MLTVSVTTLIVKAFECTSRAKRTKSTSYSLFGAFYMNNDRGSEKVLFIRCFVQCVPGFPCNMINSGIQMFPQFFEVSVPTPAIASSILSLL